MRTLKEWQKQLEQILLNIRESFLKLGENLYFARKELSKEEYDKLMTYVEQYGLKSADIQSAVAAFLFTRPDLGTEDDKRVDPALVFAGARNSKILFMDNEDQQRLLSSEKFQVVMPNGKVDKPKTWSEMSDVQRNMLIGKGGKIRPITEQMDSLNGKKRNAAIYPLGSVEGNKTKITFASRDNNFHLTASYDNLARMLLAEDCWEMLVQTVQEVKQETGNKKAATA